MAFLFKRESEPLRRHLARVLEAPEARAAAVRRLPIGWKLQGTVLVTTVVPVVAMSDTGSQFQCILTGGGISITSTVATLTVVPVRTADVNFYRSAVTGEPSLAAYFTTDGCLGTTLTNVVDATRHGILEGVVSYDGRTNRAYGQRSLVFTGGGDVQIPNNPAFEFSSGNGTIEALVYLDGGGASDGTIFAWSYDGFSVGYALQASRDGAQLIYSNDSPVLLTWPAPVNLIGRLAHVALVIDNTTNVTAYLDGQSLGQKVQSGLGPANGAPAWIGALGSGAVRRFNGRIDEVAVYGSALSENTIQVHYSRFVYGTNVSPPSITSQPGSRTVLAGAAPILQVGVSGTLPITYQWYSNGVAVAGAKSASHTVVSSAAGTSATYTLFATNAIGWTNSQPITLTFVAAPAGYASAVLQDRPSSYWRLGELSGALAADSAGYNDATYNGTLTLGQPGAVTTDPDKAVLFGGGSMAALPRSTDPALLRSVTTMKPRRPRPGEAMMLRSDDGGAMLILPEKDGPLTLALAPSTKHRLRRVSVSDGSAVEAESVPSYGAGSGSVDVGNNQLLWLERE